MSDETERCREVIARTFAVFVPELTRNYRFIPEFLVTAAIAHYLSSEQRQDTMVRYFLNSRAFKSLSKEDRVALAPCTAEDFLFCLTPFFGLPKVKAMHDALRGRQEAFEAALQRGKKAAGWDEEVTS
jgi:hypothetical protein